MAKHAKNKVRLRVRKASRTRRRVRVGSHRPRLTVFRSLKNIYAQIIDDENGRTLASASSQDKDLRASFDAMRKTDVAAKVGAALADRAKVAGVSKVAFDRGSYIYHGRVEALAKAARAGGLEF